MIGSPFRIFQKVFALRDEKAECNGIFLDHDETPREVQAQHVPLLPAKGIQSHVTMAASRIG
ncbi:hypothetical protein D7Z96_20520 [Pseudarthrobacter phenanthrenivorans]|uniref:Uncharacterized protein n=1 Tax=Pseudarthrobacter phenanthrenivorans TaxID=361575 RepID=A0A3B0FHX0_PSEPS|nr:hypothetical protein D7Z96_20520 [Pseudarthrobacter phenanthrenivorans]